ASDPADAQAGATPYARLFGLALGGTSLAEKALRLRANGASEAARAEALGLARFFAENLATAAPGLGASIVSGGQSVTDLDIPLAS
ncbi:MAG: acyl-CoA dehydrogenase C-terminal domain-containing protein, partial [Phreatobacter sp.]